MRLRPWYARRQANVVGAAHASLDRKPDEPITHVVVGYVKPRSFLSFVIRVLPGAYGADFRWFWLITTDRRIVFMALNAWGTKPTGIEWQRPLPEVSVVRYRGGLLKQLLELRRLDDDLTVRFYSPRFYRSAVESIVQALRTSRPDRQGQA